MSLCFGAASPSSATTLTSPKPEREVPVFEELRQAGMTEWLGRIFPFGELMP